MEHTLIQQTYEWTGIMQWNDEIISDKMKNGPQRDKQKGTNFFLLWVDTTSIAGPGVVMGVVHFPFQPQGERYVSLLPSLQLYLHYYGKGNTARGGIAQQLFIDGM